MPTDGEQQTREVQDRRQPGGFDVEGREALFRIQRFDPERDRRPRHQEYRLVLEQGMTVLDALMRIKETQDPTLSYRKSCRMGVCGSCALYANSLPILSCETQVSELGSLEIDLSCLPNFPILRDLVPDLRRMFDHHQAIRPWIIRPDREELDRPTGEYVQSELELERYLQFAYCIKCGCCVSACPTSATDPRFLGPQALAAAYRYAADSRDSGLGERIASLDCRHGTWRCHFAGACSEACPKGVDPALGIQLLKRGILAHRLGAKQHPLSPLSRIRPTAPPPDAPQPPEPNVAG